MSIMENIIYPLQKEEMDEEMWLRFNTAVKPPTPRHLLMPCLSNLIGRSRAMERIFVGQMTEFVSQGIHE